MGDSPSHNPNQSAVHDLNRRLGAALARYADAILSIEEFEKLKLLYRSEINELREERTKAEALQKQIAHIDQKLSRAQSEVPKDPVV